MATAREVFIELKGQLQELESPVKMLTALASDTLAMTNERIFTKGELSRGGKIAPYSTKPIYVGVYGIPKLGAPTGKFGKSKFNNGKMHRDKYLAGGYKELKQKLGRENPFDLTGQLKKSYSYQVKETEAVVGFTDSPRLALNKKSTSITMTNGKLASVLEKRYGAIFDLTAQEEAHIDEIIDNELNKIFK